MTCVPGSISQMTSSSSPRRVVLDGDELHTARSTCRPARRTTPEARAFLEKKQAEGKTRREAIRCLKRHITRRIYNLMTLTHFNANAPAITPALT